MKMSRTEIKFIDWPTEIYEVIEKTILDTVAGSVKH